MIIFPGGFREVRDEITKIRRIQAGVALGADFLFIRKAGDERVIRVLDGENRFRRRIRADAVIVAVSADHAAVQTDVARRECGNGFEFGA